MWLNLADELEWKQKEVCDVFGGEESRAGRKVILQSMDNNASISPLVQGSASSSPDKVS